MNTVPQMFLVFNLSQKKTFAVSSIDKHAAKEQVHRLLGYSVDSLTVMPATPTSVYIVADILIEQGDKSA